ncbi:hypothetical protein J3R30DRAFT_2375158 [Lentinula aciculospora]|uniref:Uncharacterized protein n=1 Tax=Lentinula aciculospora TaxID=153920 RepID=A0A9W9AEG1_9AGAR|nr:hypothetical protein J3R30DRAFT_2375158 [Lentinula aciculospora]
MASPSNAFHLRPVSEKRQSSASNSPTASSDSSSPAAEKSNMMNFRESSTHVVLRDLDLDNTLRGKFPNLPAPPTGHDLMAMFPPPAPSVASMPPNRRTEATSGYFHLQERAYFAQAGKEIIRVRVDVDVRDIPMEVEERHKADKQRSRGTDIDMDKGARRRDEDMRLPGPSVPLQHQVSPHLATMRSPRDHMEDIERVSPRDMHPKHPIPTLRRMSIDNPLSHSPPKPRYAFPPENEHDPRELRLAPPEYMNASSAYPPPDESDEAWRRPMPYAERRRAGKHTRRVVVKN